MPESRFFQDKDGEIVIVQQTPEGLLAQHAKIGAYPVGIDQERLGRMTPLTLVSPDQSKERQEKIEELRRDLLDLILMTEDVEVAPGIMTWEDNRGDTWSLKSLATNALGLAQQIFGIDRR